MTKQPDFTEYDSDVYALKDGHIAVSPFEWAEGEIVFPKSFTGGMYKAYLEAFENWENRLDVSKGWTAVIACSPTFNVWGMSDDFNTNDHRLNRWALAMAFRYTAPFLTESPWVKPSGDGTAELEKDPG